MAERKMAFNATPYELTVATLRPISTTDAPVLGAGLAAIDPWARMSYPATGLTAYLMRDDPATRRFAVWTDDNLVGVVVVREPWLRGPYLELLGLLPAAQGRGIGAGILGWMEREAQTIEPVRATNLWVLCSDFNARALAFYRRHGFEDVAPLGDLAASGFTEILLRKRLER